ncbi:MAG: sulfite exporter TauE/SafE family protein [Candidatus Adlerbacteria bacterium]|nr:sulfite exporter TauE/SafE family protein [Candidatus Adlerbacteria bacterium]
MDAFALTPAAFLAGVLMFLAPCTLPIIPGYLAFIAGVPERELAKTGFTESRRRVMRNALFFVLGFSVVFIILGLFAATLGGTLGAWRPFISRAAGAVIILFGLTMLGVLKIPVLLSEKRIRTPHFITVGRPESSFVIGVLFALGWTPCVGPILGTVLLFASSSATSVQGALLLAVFSLGLGIPFLLTAFLIGSAGKFFARMQGSITLLSKLAGGLLVVFGLSMMVGYMGVFAEWVAELCRTFGADALLRYL